MNDDTSNGRITVINIILAGFGILFLISFLDPQLFWGLNHYGNFPLWLGFAITGVLLIFCIPRVSTFIAVGLSKAALSFSKRNEVILYILIFAAMIALFLVFSSRNHLLGDGYVIEGTIRNGLIFSPTEPLEYLIHSLLFKLIGGEKGAYFSYAITSYIAGAAFLLILLIYLNDKVGVIFALALAFTFANMQFFFGYMENYTISLVLITLYLLMAWRDLSEKRVSPVTVIILIVAISFHINNTIYLVSLAYLFLAKTEAKQTAIIWAGALLGASILGVLYLKIFTQLHIEDIFIPFLPTSENPYYLFSRAHIFDLVNIWILDFPLLLICPMLLKDWDRKSRWFFAATAIPALLYVIMIDPKLGAPRDWDMMSLPAVAIMVFLFFSFGQEEGRWRSARFGIVIPLLLFSLLHTGSWIVQNHKKDTGYAWLKPQIKRDPHYSGTYFQGYRNKSWSAIVEKEYKDMKEAIRADEVRFAVAPNDTFNTCQLAVNYLANGDSDKCQKLVREFWQKFEDNQNATSILGAIMFNMKNYPEAEQIYGTYISHGGIDPAIFHDMGALMEMQGKTDSAYAYYFKAFYYWRDAPPGTELSFYLKCLLKGYTRLAHSGLTKILPKLSDNISPSVIQILKAIETNNHSKADSLVYALNAMLAAEKNAPAMR